jgi:hypothetical protein
MFKRMYIAHMEITGNSWVSHGKLPYKSAVTPTPPSPACFLAETRKLPAELATRSQERVGCRDF